MKRTIIYFVFLLLGIAVNFLPIQKSFLPYIGNYDANTYIELSRNIDFAEISNMRFLNFALGALNWFSLPLLLKLIDIENGYWRMMLINAFVLYFVVIQLSHLAKNTIISSSVFIIVSLLFMPFLWCWIFIPSKENFTVLGFLLLFNYFSGDKKKRLVTAALSLGLFKTQIIAGFISTEVLSRIRKHYFIISLLVINFITILIYALFEDALSVDLYLSHLDEQITTSGVILLIEKIIKIPVLGIFGVLLRLLIYLPAGIVAAKDLFTSFEGFLMNYSSVVTGFLSIIVVFHIKRSKPSELKIFWSFLSIFLFIPFIQFRYFWWTIPIYLYFILQKSDKDNVQDYSTIKASK